MPLHLANGQVVPNTTGLPAEPSLGPSPPVFVPEPVQGTPGSNAFTTTTSTFIVPPGDGVTPATVTVKDASWVAIGQPVYMQGAGMFEAQSVPNMYTLNLVNPNAEGNVLPGTSIGAGSKISPGGFGGSGGGGGGGTNYEITSFTIGGTGVAETVEVGTTQNTITWSAGFNFTPTAITVSCTGQPQQRVTPTGQSSDGSFTGPFTSSTNGVSISLIISATDPNNVVHTASAQMTYASRIVWGSVINPMSGQTLWDNLLGQNSLLTSGDAATCPFSSTFGQDQVFALLHSFGNPTVTDISGADEYDASLLGTLQITENGTIQTVSFYSVGAPGSVFTWKVN